MKRLLTLIPLLWLIACAPSTDPAPLATVDPFVAVEQAQRTAQAAQDEADFYAGQLTATAQAPLTSMTVTAAAWAMEQQFASATAQSVQATETAMMTQTAMSWTPTPNATSTAVALVAQAEATQQAQVLTIEQLKVERAQITNTLKAMSGYVVGFVTLIAALMFAVTFAKRLSLIGGGIDQNTGKPMPVVNVIDGVVMDVDRLTNGAGQATGAWVKTLPAITAERQNEVTNRAQLVDLQTRRNRLPAALVKAQAKNLLEAPTQAAPQLEAGEADLFPLPAWEIINGWEPKGTALPYGVTARGLGLIDVTKYPHLATIGTTGTGKSRRLMRPIIAAALAAGHRVVIVGKATDYQVFASHTNARMVKVNQMTDQNAAALYAQVLKACVDEMNRRDEILTAAHRSTWEQAGRGHTFIVLDELGNALRLMPSVIGEQARIWVEGLVSEGRKAGFSVMLANQRATGMATILSQTGKAIFRVERDEEKAHRSLLGASGLRDGYFYMKAGDENLAGGFEPSDAEIASFLTSRMVRPIEPEPWLEGIASQTSLPEPTATNADSITAAERAQIESLLDDGLSQSAIVREVWNVTGGDKWRRLKETVENIRSEIVSQRLAEGA